MKKVALLIVLMMIFAFVYAEDPVVTITGAVKGQWGMDLDNSTTGFKYVVDGLQAVIKPAVDSVQAKKTGAEGDTAYGEISMAGLRLEADSGYSGMTDYGSAALNLKWDALVAKIVMGNLTLMFKDGASTDINYEGKKADSFWLTNAYDYKIFSKRYGADDSGNSAALANSWESWNQIQFATPGANYAQTINYGLAAKLTIPDMADIALDIASYKAWDDTSRFTAATEGDNAYAGRVTFELKAVKDLILNAGTNFAIGYDPANITDSKPIAFGARAGYKIALSEDMSITPSVAGDICMAGTPVISATGGITLALPKSKITANAGYNLDTKGMAATVAADIAEIENLILQAALELIDTDATAAGGDTMAIHGKLGYGIKVDEKIKVTPYFEMSFDNKADIDAEYVYVDVDDDGFAWTPDVSQKTTTEVMPDNNSQDLFMKPGIDVTGLFSNTTLSLNWNSNDLMNTTADIDTLGELVFTVKLSF